jgi:hypothetical protein
MSKEPSQSQFLIYQSEDGRNLDFYKLDAFLSINDRDILTHAGRISHDHALAHASQYYKTFHRQRLAEDAARPDDFEKTIQQLPAPKPKKKGGEP